MKTLILDEHNDGDKETATGRTTPRLQPPKREQVQPARNNRFGFRQNTVRPTTGIAPKFSECDSFNNNNNLDNDKRRSRSASAAPRSSVSFAQSTMKTVSEERAHTNTR